jgi:hypothetical protein
MTETPGIFDPEAFPSIEEWKKAVLEAGLKCGWEPFIVQEDLEQSSIQTGKKFIQSLQKIDDS